jgi:cytochrome c-type biogenesis protein CcmF
LSLQVKPFVRCIWLGGILVAIGGLLAVTDRRYRRRKKLVPTYSNNEVKV